MKPRRKNPVLRTRQMNLPPWARGRTALGMTAAAAEGRFELQVCQRCQAVQYPPRELPSLPVAATQVDERRPAPANCSARTVLHHSNDPFYRERCRGGSASCASTSGRRDRAPAWRRASPSTSAARQTRFAAAVQGRGRDLARQPVRVHVGARLDRAGAAVLIGFPPEESEHMADDKMLREMTSDPKFRKILVTDGKTEVGQALVKRSSRPAPTSSGSAMPSRGRSSPASTTSRAAAGDAGAARPHQRPLGRPSSPARSAARSTSSSTTPRCHRAFGIAARRGTDVAKAEMDINYFGLLRLRAGVRAGAEGRSADGVTHAAAWVNLLSVYALSNYPPHGTFSASKAAAHSLAQCLRAEMRPPASA
jgi:hypothetical protein